MLEAEEGNNNIFSCGREKKVYICMWFLIILIGIYRYRKRKRRKFVTNENKFCHIIVHVTCVRCICESYLITCLFFLTTFKVAYTSMVMYWCWITSLKHFFSTALDNILLFALHFLHRTFSVSQLFISFEVVIFWIWLMRSKMVKRFIIT